MNEKDFASEIKTSIEKQLQPSHYHKIPDQIYNPNARFNVEKKYDAYVLWQGRFTALEYKIHKTSNAWSFDSVRPIQKMSLLEVKRAGGKAYIVLNVRFDNIRKCYFIPIEEFNFLVQNLTRKSIPIVELNDYVNIAQLNWMGAGEWELKRELFNEI
jgi:penicillin-binding protein-related factor A (putative recombinase)